MNFLHSRKTYFKDFSSSMKIITEMTELYFVKLQFMVVIKIIHFVSFYQYSISLMYSVYYISLSFIISLFIYCFFVNTFYQFFLVNFDIFYILFDSSQVGLLRSINFTCSCTYYHYYHYYFCFILFIIFISYFYFLVYSFCK